MIGKIIGDRYKVSRVVGGGGMSVVYLATDLILHREVAIKVLRSDFSNSPDYLRRFNREGRSASSLSHTNIVSILDVGEENGNSFLVMEYIDGLTLKEYIQTFAPIPMEKVLDIMKQLTSAIAHAHKNQIVHRDIKPHNILIDRDGNVKVTDFGIATAVSAATMTQTNSAVLGSVHYLSPEQARGGQANYKSDIYSLGIVMFEMLTGKLPFSGDSAVSIALKHLQTETPSTKEWNAAIPQSVENVVLRATAKSPTNRYQSVEEMEIDLETVLDPERLFEEKYVEPQADASYDDATKVVPAISQKQFDEATGALTMGNDKNGKSLANSKDKNSKSKGKGKNKKAKKPKTKGQIIMLSLGGALALAAIVFLFTFFLTDTFQPVEVTVPDVSDMSVDKATSVLKSKGFEIGKKTATASDKVEKDKIVKTKPEAGKKLEEGSKVDLYYSKGSKEEKVPEYTGKVYDDISEAIDDAGFKDVKIEYVNSEDDSGTIISQDPEPGDKVSFSKTVLKLTVSKGSDKIVLKDLRDYSSKALNDYANEAGINIQVTGEQYSDTVPSGSVISQNPAAGTKLDQGASVSVVVSKGKEPEPEPEPEPELKEKNVTKEVSIDYTGQNSDPQTVKIYISDLKHNMNSPAMTFTITEDTIKDVELVLNEETDGEIRVTVNDKIVSEESVPY